MSADDKARALLPCPFCGGEAEVLGYDASWGVISLAPGCAVGMGGDLSTEAEAIAAWNRRAYLASAPTPRTSGLRDGADVALRGAVTSPPAPPLTGDGMEAGARNALADVAAGRLPNRRDVWRCVEYVASLEAAPPREEAERLAKVAEHAAFIARSHGSGPKYAQAQDFDAIARLLRARV
jgi:hypothetical protein